MKFFRFILPPALLLLSAACTRRVYVPVENVHVRADTLHIRSSRTDSVVICDSIILRQNGDTVIKEMWRLRERTGIAAASRDRVSHDTVIREIPVETIRTVTAAKGAGLSAWQRLRMHTGSAALIIVSLSIIYILIRLRLKNK